MDRIVFACWKERCRCRNEVRDVPWRSSSMSSSQSTLLRSTQMSATVRGADSWGGAAAIEAQCCRSAGSNVVASTTVAEGTSGVSVAGGTVRLAMGGPTGA